MRAIVGMPERVRSMRTVSTSFSFASIGARAREEAAAVLALLGRERRDEKAVLERGLAHRRGGHLTAPS